MSINETTSKLKQLNLLSLNLHHIGESGSDRGSLKIDALCTILEERAVSIACLQDLGNPGKQKSFKIFARKMRGDGRLPVFATFGNSRSAISVSQTILHHVVDVISDETNRFCGICLQVQAVDGGDMHLFICSYYRLPGVAPDVVGTRAEHDRVVLNCLRKKQEEGNVLILCGDLNLIASHLDHSDPSASPSPYRLSQLQQSTPFCDTLSNLDLVDLWRFLFPRSHGFTFTAPRSQSRLDYIFTSAALIREGITIKVGDGASDQAVGSDHFFLFASFPIFSFLLPDASPFRLAPLSLPSDPKDPKWTTFTKTLSDTPPPQPPPEPPPIDDLVFDTDDDPLFFFIDKFQSTLYKIAAETFGTRQATSGSEVRRRFRSKPRRRLARAIKGIGGMVRALDTAALDLVVAFKSYNDSWRHAKRNKAPAIPPLRSIAPLLDPGFVTPTRNLLVGVRRDLNRELNELIREEETAGVVRGVLSFVRNATANRGHFYKNLHKPSLFPARHIYCARDPETNAVVWEGDRVKKLSSDYGESLFCAPVENDPALAAAFVEKISPPRPGPDWIDCETGPFSELETLAAIRAQDAKKSPGDDAITGALLHRLPPPWVDCLRVFYSTCLACGRVPSSLRFGIIKTIPKKDVATLGDLSCLRCITLLSCLLKVFERLILQRLLPFLSPRLDLNQRGFLPGRTTNQCIRFLDTILTSAKVNKTDLFLSLVDERKAFDSVPPWVVVLGLQRLGVPALYINLVSNLLSPSQLSFITTFGLSPPFYRRRGVPQGGVCSPVYFVIAFDLLLGRLRYENVGLHISPSPSLHLNPSSSIMAGFVAFADDLAIFSKTATEMVAMLEIVDAFGIWTGIHINPAKSIIVANSDLNLARWQRAFLASPVLRGKQFEVMGEGGVFRYLGVLRSAGKNIFQPEIDRLLRFTNLSSVLTASRWVPPSIAPRYINELVGGTLQYSFQSTPAPPPKTLRTFTVGLNRTIRGVFRIARTSHIPAIRHVFNLFESQARWRASVIFDSLVALHQTEWPALQAASVNLLIDLTSPSASSIVTAKSVDGVIRGSVDGVGWGSLPRALRDSGHSIVPFGIHHPPSPVPSRAYDFLSGTTRLDSRFRGYGVVYLHFSVRDGGLCLPVHAWLWRLDDESARIVFSRGGLRYYVVAKRRDLVASGVGSPFFSARKKRSSLPRVSPFFSLATLALRWRRPGAAVAVHLFLSSQSADHHTITLELFGDPLLTVGNDADFDGSIVLRLDKRGMSVAVARAMAAVLACAFCCDGRVVRSSDEKIVSLAGGVGDMSARDALKKKGGQYISALKQMLEAGLLPSFVFDEGLDQFDGDIAFSDVTHDPLLLLPIPFWALLDRDSVVVTDRIRPSLRPHFRAPINPSTAIGSAFSTHNPDFEPLRKAFADPALHSKQSLLHFIVRAVSGSLPTHHRLLRARPRAPLLLNCPQLDLNCKLCRDAHPQPDKQLHVLALCPFSANLRLLADSTIAPLYNFTPCPSPVNGVCACDLGDLLSGVSVVTELHDVAAGDVSATVSALHAFARDRSYVIVYTDGSWTRPSLTGGAGGILVSHSVNAGVLDNSMFFSTPVADCTSSSHAELFAIVFALSRITPAVVGPPELITVFLFCDSSVAIGWASGASVPDDPANRFLVGLFSEICLTRRLKVIFFKVKGHAGVKGNELADRYAKAGALLDDSNVGRLHARLPYTSATADLSLICRQTLRLHRAPPLISNLQPDALMISLCGGWLPVGRPKGKLKKTEIVVEAAKIGFNIWKERNKAVKVWERSHRLFGKWWVKVDRRLADLAVASRAEAAAAAAVEAAAAEAELSSTLSSSDSSSDSSSSGSTSSSSSL